VDLATDLHAVSQVDQVLVVADSKLPIRLEYVLRSRWPRAEYRVVSRTSDAAAQLAATAAVEGIVVLWEQSAAERIVPVSDLLELQPIVAPRTYGDGIVTVLRSAARPASGTEDSATRAGEAG
jgi:hypothetical protein